MMGEDYKIILVFTMANIEKGNFTQNSFLEGRENIWKNLSGKVTGWGPLASTPQQFMFLRNIPYLRGETPDPLSSKITQVLSDELNTKILGVKQRQIASARQLELNNKNVQGNSIPTYDNRNYTISYYKLKKPFSIPKEVYYMAGAAGLIYFMSLT